MKNLEKFGVQELTTVEQRENQGGFWPVVISLLVVFAVGVYVGYQNAADADPNKQ